MKDKNLRIHIDPEKPRGDKSINYVCMYVCMYVTHVGHFSSKITKLVQVGIHYHLSIKLLKALCTMQSMLEI